MALPFVKLDDIDCCFEELKETKPEIDEEDRKIDQFIEYFENTQISDQCDQYSSKTDNISETYNHQINGLKDAKIALLKKDYEPDTIDIHIPYIHF